MTSTQIYDLFRRVDIFVHIPDNILAAFTSGLKEYNFREGETIIYKGDEGNSMYVISEGILKVHDGKHKIAELHPGNFFGEFSLLDEAPRSMSVSALSDSKLVRISREHFFSLFREQPEIARQIIKSLTLRLRKQNESIITELRNREAELSRQVEERTKELVLKNKEITDNVNYARRIQQAILPDDKTIDGEFEDSFILYIPKDIVSGDFYSFFKAGAVKIIVAADCTGHGVSGAFLSLLGHSLLNQIITEKKLSMPGEILDELHESLVSILNQRNKESTDGMDAAVCCYTESEGTLHYAGANRPMWLLRDKEFKIFTPNKYPVGGLQISHDKYNNHSIQTMKGDTVYIFSDGFADQFGGDKGKKLMVKNFRETLLSISGMNMQEQKKFLSNFFNDWKGQNEQVDDVLVIGLKF
ncbi:MAG: hypothetical protein DWQ33_03065 [Bacteroidetes bacterium]|nr:MAG: hypothetical protein DWQ33_03065 [Bacteroidota bacterium]